MDIEAYWQENRRFVTTVAIGLLVFLLGKAFIGRTVGADLTKTLGKKRATVSKIQRLEREGYSGEALDLILADNEALEASLSDLRSRAGFRPRPGFGLDGGERVTPVAYLSQVARVRDELLPLAGRANVAIDSTLGLPELSPTREDELVRHLEALDQIEYLLRIAIEERVAEVDRMRIRIDPGLRGRGVGVIERTRIDVRLRGENRAVLETLRRLEREPRAGTTALIEELEMSQVRERPDEARADLVLVLARIAKPQLDVEG